MTKSRCKDEVAMQKGSVGKRSLAHARIKERRLRDAQVALGDTGHGLLSDLPGPPAAYVEPPDVLPPTATDLRSAAPKVAWLHLSTLPHIDIGYPTD